MAKTILAAIAIAGIVEFLGQAVAWMCAEYRKWE